MFITLIAAFITSVSQLAFKSGIQKRLESLRDIMMLARNLRVVAGVAGYVLGLVVYLYALEKAPLSIVYPTFASTFVFVALLSFFVLREKFSATRIVGVLVIFFGIFLVSLTV